MKKAIEDLIRISRYAGERFDLAQSGGGNSSVKPGGGRLLVKASGLSMADMTVNSGFVDVDLEKIICEIENTEPAADVAARKKVDSAAEECLQAACHHPALRPSIETFMHAVVGKFALHVHPLAVNAAVCSEKWDDVPGSLFPGAIFVDTLTAGVSLGAVIKEEIEKNEIDLESALFIFLRNHGLIVSAVTADDVINGVEQVVLEMERAQGLDFSRYRSVSAISSYARRGGVENRITYLSDDAVIRAAAGETPEAFHVPPFCPDMMVFNGEAPLALKNLDDAAPLKEYVKKHQIPPTVILHGGEVYISAPSLHRARDFESVLKAHLEIVMKSPVPTAPLSHEDNEYLKVWEAEKRRRQ